MPSLPPGARRERVETYARAGFCGGVRWEGQQIKSGDGMRVAVLVGGMGQDKGEREGGGGGGGEREIKEGEGEGEENGEDGKGGKRRRRRVVVVYFQGWVFSFFSLSL